MARRLSVLIVNYRSGAFALALCRQLARRWREAGGAPADLERVVVDNASPAGADGALASIAAEGACVIESGTNLGYAAGMNLAFQRSRGDAQDLVLVLNPDVALFPGALRELLAAAERETGPCVVAPRVFLEPTATWRMPPNRLPTPRSEAESELASRDASLAAELSARRTTHARREWEARGPIDVEMLSGCALLMSRATIEAMGGLFDPRYPLYFEDTDLAMRLRQVGGRCVLDPRARFLHHWARSSGIEEADPTPLQRQRISRDAFFARWFPGEELDAALRAHQRPATPGGDVQVRIGDLGSVSEAPRFHLPHSGPWLFELAMAESFPLAAGAFVDGADWTMPARAFEWFYRGRYYVRALLRDSTVPVAAWTFEKTSVARSRPLDEGELSIEGRA